MSKYSGLSDFVGFNSEFRNAINLELNLNHREKLLSYIPTKSSVDILKRYLKAIQNNSSHASMLIGPYGKGKSHLLLVLLAIVSLDRDNKDDIKVFKQLSEKIEKVDKETFDLMNDVWNHKNGKFFPIIINSQSDVNQAFLLGLSKALNAYGLSELTPKTDFIYAVETIDNWKKNYKETYTKYISVLKDKKISQNAMKAELMQYNQEYLKIFKEIYPSLTSGGVFNPLADSDVTRLYMSVADVLREEYGYRGIYIVFDEFSKFIEGQDKMSAGLNMKLVQDVCEMCADSKDPQIHIILVAHKPIKEYGNRLRQETINSFTGIEGRLESEIIFSTSSKNNYELIKNAIIKEEDDLLDIPEEIQKRYFSEEVIRDNYSIPGFESEFTYEDFEEIVVKGCYPLTPVASYLLLNISEKVAQNERTLFTFISKDEPCSMPEYISLSKGNDNIISDKWAVTPDLVYDYFTTLFRDESDDIKEIYQKSVTALAIAEKKYKHNELPIRIIKTLAIMMIVDNSSELPWNDDVLRQAVNANYSEFSKEQFADAIIYLEDLDIIEVDGNNFFKFKTIEGKELESVIDERWRLVANEKNINNDLQRVFRQKYIFPKKYNYEYGMTRYFRYTFFEVTDFLKVSSDKVFFDNGSFCDGRIVCLYQLDENDYEEQIEKKLLELASHKIIVMYARKIFDIHDIVLRLQVVSDIAKDTAYIEKNGKIITEIQDVVDNLETQISEYLNDLYGRFGEYTVSYFIDGAVVHNQKTISESVDELCYKVYNATPKVNNEFVNKQFITTGATKTARKTVIDKLLMNDPMEDYLTGTSQDATIYRALFVRNGVRTGQPENNIKTVLNIYEQYIKDCTSSRQRLSKLTDIISREPYGIRLGLIPIYLAYTIGCKDADIVVYYGDKEISITADTVINMCENPEQYELFVSQSDACREMYLDELIALFDIKVNRENADSRVSQILSGMQKWYRALPQVTINAKSDKDYFTENYLIKAVGRMNKLLQRFEVNPYEALFELIPEAFSTNENLDKCIERLAEFKKKMNGYYQWVVNNAILETKKVLSDSNDSLYHIMKNWYMSQSNTAKGTINDQSVASLMKVLSVIIDDGSPVLSDENLVDQIVKAISGVHIDYWNSMSLQQYIEKLHGLKLKIEGIKDTETDTTSKQEIYTSRSGKQFFYDVTDSDDADMFREVLAGTIEDFEGLGKNDIISVLLDEVERILQTKE